MVNDVAVWEGDLFAGALPPICVLTGEAGAEVRAVRYQSLPAWVFLLILFGIVPFLVGYLMTRRLASGWLPMSPRARRRLAALRLLGVGLAVGLPVLTFFAAWTSTLIDPDITGPAFLVGLLISGVAIFAVDRWYRAEAIRGFVGDAGPWGRWITLYNVNPTFAAAVERMYTQRANQLRESGYPNFIPVPGAPPWATRPATLS
jgi:hypothetical protein